MEGLNKNIVAVSWAMPPLLFPRALQISRLLKQWALQGWKTTVITAEPESLKAVALLDNELDAFYKPYYTTVPVHSPEGSFLLRGIFRLAPFLRRMPDERRLWANSAYQQALRLPALNQASVLVSFAQPWSSHLVGLRLHEKTGLPWIAHFSDPWTVGSHAHMSRWDIRQAKQWEKQVIENATRLVFVTSEAAEATLANYPAAFKNKVRVVPHGFERDILDAWPAPAPSPHARLRLVHTGHFYGPRTPWALLDALASLHRETPLNDVLEIIFVGHIPADFLNQAQARGLARVVTSTGPRSYFDSLRMLQSADALLLIEAASPETHLYFPSKLVDYFLFNKPIVALSPLHSPSAALLYQMKCPVVDPNDVGGIQQALAKLLKEKAAGRLGISASFANLAETYDIRHTAAAFQTILEEVQKN